VKPLKMSRYRWFRILEGKLKTFYNKFPVNVAIKSIIACMQAFTAIYKWTQKTNLTSFSN